MKKRKQLSPEELSLFTAQCALILRSGILLIDGIEILVPSFPKDPFLSTIAQALEQGDGVYEAFEHAGCFPDYMLEMIRIGEETGELDTIMDRLASYYRKEAKLKDDIKQAILYPMVLLGMMAIVIAVLIFKVVPIFLRVYADLGLHLEGANNGFLQAGIYIGDLVLVLVLLFMLLILIGHILYRYQKGQKIGYMILRLKPFSTIVSQVAASRFCQIYSMANASGYSKEAILASMPRFMPTPSTRRQAELLKKEMEKSDDFAQAITISRLFDPLSEKMIEVGVATGKIDSVLDELAELYAQKADHSIEDLVSIIEPSLVALLTLIVGGLLLAIMLPLISLLVSMG